MKRILIVDDDKTSLTLAKMALESDYTVIPVISGAQALKYLEKRKADLILLDIYMPEMDGIATLGKIQQMDGCKNIPVVFVTGEADITVEAKCLEMGAKDFILKPIFKPTLLCRINRILELEDLRQDMEKEVMAKTRKIESYIMNTIFDIACTVDAKDEFTKNHSQRVSHYCEQIAKALNWDKENIENLRYSALLHDIGNISIPEKILSKPGSLDDNEYDKIKEHTVAGAELLDDIKVIRDVTDGAKYHHEHYDGSGYNEGLSGDKIPINARIIAVADAYDAMTTDRPYRNKLDKNEVLDELTEGKGTQFDPELVDVLMGLINEGMEPAFKTDDDYSEDENAGDTFMGRISEDLRIIAKKDVLTGLWNKQYLCDRVNLYLCSDNAEGTLLVFDLDKFGRINQTYGNIVGDEVLQNISAILKQCTNTDNICARIGGDEFAVFLKDTSEQSDPTEYIVEINGEINKLTVMGIGERVSASFGIAVSESEGHSFETLFEKADKALYYVKTTGGANYHFYREKDGAPARSTADIMHIKSFIEEEERQNGAYNVELDGFKKIYRFISRSIERTGNNTMLVLATITDYDGMLPDAETLNDAYYYLDKSITLTLRSGDVAAGYSSSQILVILNNANDSGAALQRILNNFREVCRNDNIKIRFDVYNVITKELSEF